MLFPALMWVSFIVPAVRSATLSSELVATLPPTGGASFSSFPSNGVALGAFFYFAASDGPNGTTGRELWRTDGSAAGTTLVKDIRPGGADSSPDLLTVAGTNLYFVADDGIHGRELWRSDGSTVGTVPVTDLNLGLGDALITSIKGASNLVYFTRRYSVSNVLEEFFKSDSTPGGTIKLAGPGGLLTTNGLMRVYGPARFDTYQTNAVFSEYLGGISNAVWRTDGTVSGSARLEVIFDSFYVDDMRVLGSKLYYFVDLFGGVDLIRRDLVPGSSTRMIRYTNANAAELQMTIENSRLYYSLFSYGCSGGPISFCSGGTFLASVDNNASAPAVIAETGISILAERLTIVGQFLGSIYYTDTRAPQKIFNNAAAVAVDLQPLGLFPKIFMQAPSNNVYFGASTNNQSADPDRFGFFGPGAGPLPTVVIFWTPPNSSVRMLGGTRSIFYFQFDDGLLGAELWRTTNSTIPPILVKDIAVGNDSPPPTEAIAVGANLFLSAESPGLGRELWFSDGTAPGTALVKDIRLGALGSNPTNLTAWNGALYFFADDGSHGVELWKSDGTSGGTALVRDVRVGPASSNPSQLVATSNLLFFIADDGAHGAELWRSDGTSNGTFLAQDIVPGLNPGRLGALNPVGDVVYFVADAGSFGPELWFSDGQPGGTQFLKELNPGTNASVVTAFNQLNGFTYFTSSNLVPSLPSVWRTDATPDGTVMITNNAGYEIRAAGPRLFITGQNSLFQNDGTPGNLILLKQFSAQPARLTAVSNRLFFTVAEDLWTTDGTSNGTVIVGDFPLPAGLPSPDRLTPLGGALLFTANTPAFGNEFWAAAPGQVPTLVEDLDPGSANPNIRLLAAKGNRVFYVARPAGNAEWQIRALRLLSLAPPQRSPWSGSASSVPGHIEAEEFDIGGEGVAFHDTTLVNEGGQFRKSEGVDIDLCTDTNAGFCVTLTRPDEWLEYTMNVTAAGLYRLDVRLSSTAPGGTFDVGIDGSAGASAVSIPNTAGAWLTLAISNVVMNSGAHLLRLTFTATNSSGSAGSINWLDWTLTGSNVPPSVAITAPAQGTIVPVGSSVAINATINDATSLAPPRAEFFVDGISISTNGASPYRAFFTVTPGPHVARVRATDSFGATTESQGRLFFGADQLIALESTWLYTDAGADLGTAWRQVSYNDDNWDRGQGQFGFGDGDENTILAKTNRLRQPILTYYFRKPFVLTNDLSANYATVTLVRDDAAVVYANGHELGRFNLPKGSIVYTNLGLTNINNVAFGTDAAVDTFVISPGVLTNGLNVIAVEIHQAAFTPASQYDLSFDLSLSAFAYNPGPVLNISVRDTNSIVRWPDYLPDWELEQSPDLDSWFQVSVPIVREEDRFIAEIPLDRQQFFRLRKR